MYLPKNGKEKWTKIMEAQITELSTEVLEGQPIVMSTATFDDGFWVAGGVYKSEEPTDYNIKFMNVFTPDGQQIPFLIDPSDHEDFRQTAYIGYIYDEAVGDEDSGLVAGTKFEDIPDTWVCPVCGVAKGDVENWEKQPE